MLRKILRYFYRPHDEPELTATIINGEPDHDLRCPNCGAIWREGADDIPGDGSCGWWPNVDYTGTHRRKSE